jgi:hypothetical protein
VSDEEKEWGTSCFSRAGLFGLGEATAMLQWRWFASIALSRVWRRKKMEGLVGWKTPPSSAFTNQLTLGFPIKND